jgi:hypothetical protein
VEDGSEEEVEEEQYVGKSSKKKEKKRQEREAQRQVSFQEEIFCHFTSIFSFILFIGIILYLTG